MYRFARLLAALLSALVVTATALAEPLYPGPILAEVKRVIDGDTLVLDAFIWPNTKASDVSLRVRGIDTPERRGQCEQERQLAEQATTLMAQHFRPGQTVALYQIETGKYGGRFIAGVRNDAGLDWAAFIQGQGLAAPYEGRGPKQDWCAASLASLIKLQQRKP